MSAYVVENDHIGYLLAAAMQVNPSWLGPDGDSDWVQFRAGDYDLAERVGQMLLTENINSYNYRYRENGDGGLQFNKADIGNMFDFDAAQVFKAIKCYEYQSCEHPEWEQSEAWRFCQALKNATIYKIAGYEDAEWGAPKGWRIMVHHC